MSPALLQKNVKKLIEFFEKQSEERSMSFSFTEYKKILIGINILCLNTSEEIDFTRVAECLKFKNNKNKISFLAALEKSISTTVPNETHSYNTITEILKLYSVCLSKYRSDFMSAQQWVEIGGYLHPLEMERLKPRIN